MSKECRKKEASVNPADPCCPPEPVCCAGSAGGGAEADCPLTYFEGMVGHCLEYAEAAKEAGRPVVGIMCEFTPRELIMAAGGIPACLCGGSAEMIPPAEEHLPVNLCPLIKSTYGYHSQKANPFLEMSDLIVAETTCDGKKKMFELMGEGRSLYVLELPQKADEAGRLDQWTRELGGLKAELARRFDVEITDEKVREAIGVMNR
ncbi:MAG: 2-hydroxyacyl-CoA dehydratase family protein, partial [Phycisphaerae bacterium]